MGSACRGAYLRTAHSLVTGAFRAVAVSPSTPGRQREERRSLVSILGNRKLIIEIDVRFPKGPHPVVSGNGWSSRQRSRRRRILRIIIIQGCSSVESNPFQGQRGIHNNSLPFNYDVLGFCWRGEGLIRVPFPRYNPYSRQKENGLVGVPSLDSACWKRFRFAPSWRGIFPSLSLLSAGMEQEDKLLLLWFSGGHFVSITGSVPHNSILESIHLRLTLTPNERLFAVSL